MYTYIHKEVKLINKTSATRYCPQTQDYRHDIWYTVNFIISFGKSTLQKYDAETWLNRIVISVVIIWYHLQLCNSDKLFLFQGKVVIRPIAFKPAMTPAARFGLAGERYGSTPILTRPGSRLTLYGSKYAYVLLNENFNYRKSQLSITNMLVHIH